MTGMTKRVARSLPAAPGSAALARAFIRREATLDSMRHAEADLLVTELIGNAIAHSEAEEVTVEIDQDRERGLTVTVSHIHPGPMAVAQTGTGLFLLERLARRWGHSHDGEHLRVWFVLRTPGSTAVSVDLSDEELVARMGEDPAAYSDELLRRHTNFAAALARRFRGKGIDQEDLVQVANMALIKAIQRYDPEVGPLRPYAAVTISGELKRMLRDRGWSVRVPRSLQERILEVSAAAEEIAQELNRAPEPHELARYLDMSEDEVTEALAARKAYTSDSMNRPREEHGDTPLERLEDEDLRLLMADDRLMVADAISRLPEREQVILQLRFNDDMTQAEIADLIGISQMHVSRLLARALESLKESIGREPESA